MFVSFSASVPVVLHLSVNKFVLYDMIIGLYVQAHSQAKSATIAP